MLPFFEFITSEIKYGQLSQFQLIKIKILHQQYL